MTWVRWDDHAEESGKVLGLSDKAYRAWKRSVSYCSRDLTDGWIWAGVAAMYAAAKVRDELEASGFWHRFGALCPRCEDRDDRGVRGEPGDWYVHDYLDFNPPKVKVLEKRAAESARKARQGARSVTRNPAQADVPRPVPSRPTPINAKGRTAAPDGAAVDNLAEALLDASSRAQYLLSRLTERIDEDWSEITPAVLIKLGKRYGAAAVIEALAECWDYGRIPMEPYPYLESICVRLSEQAEVPA